MATFSRFQINPINNQNRFSTGNLYGPQPQGPFNTGVGAFIKSLYTNPTSHTTLASLGLPELTPQTSTNPSNSYYKDTQNNVFDANGNHIDLPTFQKLGLNITQIPLKDVRSSTLIPSGGDASAMDANANQKLLNNQNQNETAAMINQALLTNGQNPFQNQMNGMSNADLQQLLGLIQNQGQSQIPNYTDILNQARKSSGINDLANNVFNILGQLQQVNASQRNLLNQPKIDAMTGGVLTQGVQNAQSDIAQGNTPQSFQNILQQQSLAEQGNLAQNRLNFAQGQVGQTLGAAQAQGQLGLGYGQLALQQNLNPAQQALLQAQAQQAQAQAGFFSSIYGGLNQPRSQNNQSGVGVLPQFLQGATTQDINGQNYIVESRVPSLQGMGTDAAKSYAGRLGVPILNDSQASSITALDTTQNNLKDLQSKIGGLLGSGLAGRVQGLTLNNLEKFLGIGKGPALQQIDSFRESAIKQIQGLASGNTGLRLNQAEINSAIQNLPTSSDNIEQANAKLQQLAVFFANQRAAIFALGGLRSSVHAMTGGDTFSVGW